MRGDRFSSTKFEEDVQTHKHELRKKNRVKTKKKMKVSGAGVKQLQRLIIK